MEKLLDVVAVLWFITFLILVPSTFFDSGKTPVSRWYVSYNGKEDNFEVKIAMPLKRDTTIFQSSSKDSCEVFGEKLIMKKKFEKSNER